MTLDCQGVVEAIKTELEHLRKLERSQRVNHSTHADYDGNPCDMKKTWNTRWARDIAVVLDRIGVRDDPSAPEVAQ